MFVLLRSFLSPFFVMVLSVCASSAYAQTTATNQVVTFYFTGAPQTFTVPANTYSITVDAWGAAGGNGENGGYGTYTPGGEGARVQATLAVVPGQVLTLYVGSMGGTDSRGFPCGCINGGYNGGGNGADLDSYYSVGYGTMGGPGGGASDIRTGSATLADRVLVAGGGGGGAAYVPEGVTSNGAGGSGGAPDGGNGDFAVSNLSDGKGATQTSGFALGQGQSGAFEGIQAGGGAGYYGGYASFLYNMRPGGGGGGSSWVTPTGSSNVQMTSGGTQPNHPWNGGLHGEIRITVNQSVAPTITSLSSGSGSVGSVVTITGTNFTGATEVTFNGTAATSFTVNTATQITAIVPDGATTGNIVVTVGNDSSDGVQFIVSVAPTITFADIAKTYGDANFNLIATSNSSGAITYSVVSGTAATVSASGEVTITGAGSVQIRATQAADGNYTSGEKTITLTIQKASATITLTTADFNQTYSGSGKTVGYTTNPAGVTGVSVTYSQSGNAVVAPTAAGSYDVVASLTNDNYLTTSASGTLVIGKAAATVTLGNLTTTYTGSPLAATATTDPLGLTVNLTYNGVAQAPTNAGSYTVAGIIDDINYEGSASGTLVIDKAASVTTVTVPAGPYTYTGLAQTPATVNVTGTGGLNKTQTAIYTNNINAGTATASYTYSGDANHEGSDDSKTFDISRATASVTPENNSKVYGGAEPSLGGAIDGFVAADGVTASYSRVAGETVAGGPYTISATLSPAAVLGNYDITYNTASFTITQALYNFYVDADGDSYGAGSLVQVAATDATTPPAGYSTMSTDCNDRNAAMWRSGAVYIDADGDGYDNGSTTLCYGATLLTGYAATTNGSDCNDNNAAINVKTTWYRDADRDGYGNAAISTTSCSQPTGYVANSTDCNDSKAAVHTNATEVCGDGIDNNCNGQIDENCGGIPAISINDVSVYESEGVAVVTVSLDRVSTSAISINYATQNGTAIGSGKGAKAFDFTTASGSVTIAAGTKTAQMRITITKDNSAEVAESFKVNVSLDAKNAKKATITKGSGTVTIYDGIKPALTNTQSFTKTATNEVQPLGFEAIAYPNPTTSSFTIKLSGNHRKELISMIVMDVNGRMIDKRANVAAGQTLQIGSAYRPGIYYAEVMQGAQKITLKLVKTSN